MNQRREFLRLSAGIIGAGGLAIWSGCKQEGATLTVPSLTPEQQLALLKQACVIGVRIGDNLQALEHPALRIAGMALESGSKLAVSYIAYRDGSRQIQRFDLDAPSVEHLQTQGYVNLVRIDGAEEMYCICPGGLAAKAIKLFTND